MSYGPPYGQQPPYGGQQGGWPPAQGQYGQQPPPQGQYGQPPHGPPPGQYGQPPPGPPPGQYGQPPPGPPPGQYGQQPGWGAPPPVPQHPQQQSYGAPPIPAHPNQSYGQPPPQQYPVQSFNGPPQHHGPPTPPSPGYGPPQNIGYSGDADADALRKAMKGFGTDEQVLISILARRDPLQISAIRNSFNNRLRRDLEADIKSETRSYFEMGLVALSRGPLIQDCHVLHDAMKGLGTRETELNDVLLSRSNADMRAIKSMYQQIFKRSLESDLRGDLSMKTERHFMMIVAGNRAEDSAPIVPAEIDRDVADIYRATEGKTGTDELLVCSILTQRNDAQIRTIAQIYEQKFRRSLETVIKNEFSGHMQSALLGQLQGGTDRAMRDATALEEAMAGLGTKDRLLVNRVIRFHWNREHMQQIKGAYRHKYKKELDARIGGETSGDYRKLMLACL